MDAHIYFRSKIVVVDMVVDKKYVVVDVVVGNMSCS